jgi:ribose-phosphate pyrophosphokinase
MSSAQESRSGKVDEPLWSPSAPAQPLADSSMLKLFALHESEAMGEAIAAHLGCALSKHEEREFEDGEHKARPLDNVCGANAYVVHSLHSGPKHSADKKLCRLLFFIGALKDAGAAQVTAVTPYLCYARKDRRTKPHDPVTIRYTAAMFEAVGTNRVVTLEVHNPAAFENAFRCPTVTLNSTLLWVDYCRRLGDDRLCIVSPDTGGAKRSELLRQTLETVTGREVQSAFAEKYRSGGIVSGHHFVGDVSGATALIIDDLISSGGTLLRAAKAARQAGARRVIALVTHGLFMEGAEEAVADEAIDRLAITDTVPPFRLGDSAVLAKIDIIPGSAMIAEAIGRMYENRPLTDLLVF